MPNETFGFMTKLTRKPHIFAGSVSFNDCSYFQYFFRVVHNVLFLICCWLWYFLNDVFAERDQCRLAMALMFIFFRFLFEIKVENILMFTKTNVAWTFCSSSTALVRFSVLNVDSENYSVLTKNAKFQKIFAQKWNVLHCTFRTINILI